MKLREIRQSRNLTIPQLVEMTGISRRTLQDIEKRGDCLLSTACKICLTLGITLDELCPIDIDIIKK